MLRNYFRIAFRSLLKNKSSSLINIGGLAIGMAVALLIGVWIYDELSFDQSNDNYDRIGQVWQHVKFEKEKETYSVMPIPVGQELRSKYPDFKYVSVASQTLNTVLASGEKKLSKMGKYVEPDFTEMLSLKMERGSRSLKEPNSILLSHSLAKAIFGDEDPMNKVIRIDNEFVAKVAGVYQDFPENNTFKNLAFLAPWGLYRANKDYVRKAEDNWDENSYQVYAQLKEGADFGKVSAKIKDMRVKRENPPPYRPEFFLYPMNKWHLYSDFKNGVNVGGMIEFVWLFGIIGAFVLVLACINFMNLSTARSEKRAREVGIRKAIGSVRRQLVVQFLSESILVAVIAFAISLLLAQLALPLFNIVAGKNMVLPWNQPVFWLIGIGFSALTGLFAGSYPALYLSSFNPVKVLKGTFRVGRFASIPRKVLVVLQFTVSICLIIGTIVVFRQIEYAKDRSVGYDRNGLIEVGMTTPELHQHFAAIRNDLKNSGAVVETALSSCSITGQDGGTTAMNWRTKPPDAHPLIMSNGVTKEFGKTVGWKITRGRDFSTVFSDSSSMVINEATAKQMGIKNPVGETVSWGDKQYQVIGVIDDMVRESPFLPVRPSFFVLNKPTNIIVIKLSPKLLTSEAIQSVEKIFRQYNPASPFDYFFVDKDFAEKLGDEERIGKLATAFAILAVLISCLGLFGLASFVAEQRTKEIGVRKVLGASVLNVWRLLSKEFVVLVLISILIATPIAYYFMNKWLQDYDYRQELSFWIFGAAGLGAILITLATVSYQSLKAAFSNPVKSLRAE